MKIAVSIILILVVVLAAAYLAVGYYAYDQLSKVVSEKERFENNPSDFQVTYEDVKAAVGDFDTRPYLMKNYEDVSFKSRKDGLKLVGWYIETDPAAPAVIVTHGFQGGKWSGNALTVAGMLSHSGFNVLMFDIRNHGKSEGDTGRISVGNKEYLDILGAWDYLVNERGYDPARIGLYGLSLGAASTLNAFAEEPRIAAALVDSPFSDLQKIIEEEMARTGYPTFLAPATIISARLFGGVNLVERTPKDAIRKSSGRPLFIIHGMIDKRVPVHHTQELVALAKESGVAVDVWYVDDANHVFSMFLHPQEYQEKMAAFYHKVLK